MADAASGRWAGMEETLGLVLAVNQEPPQVSPPFLQEASPRCSLSKPLPVQPKSRSFGRALDPGETSPSMGTPGVGVLLPAWCPAHAPQGHADSEARAVSGFLLGCRHRSSAERTRQKPPAMSHGHPAGFGAGRQSLGAGMFWDLSKGKLVIQVLLRLHTIICSLQVHFKQP